MGLSPSGFAGPERPMAQPFYEAVAAGPKGEGRAIAGMVLAIVALPALLFPPLGGGLMLLALMLGCDAWEDIERDPTRRGRGYAIAAFWIVGVTFALGVVAGVVIAIVG